VTEAVASEEALPTKLDPRHKVILAVLLISTFVVFLNETILGVALPEIMAQLQIPASTGQWLNTAYMLTMAVIIPITGFLLQRFSTRSVYIAAMALFSIGTLLAAISPDFSILLIARILQASGTAIMMPLMMTTIMVVVPENLRGSIMGVVSIVMSVAPAIGPAVSGLILSFAGWRMLFWVVLPIALVTLIIGSIQISSASEPRKIKLDYLSVVLSALAFSGVIYGLSSFATQAQGTSELSPWLPLGFGAVMLALFLLRQAKLQKSDDALLDLRTFRSREFTMAMLLMAIAMMSMFGTLLLLPIYMQDVLGMAPLATGLFLLPGGLIMGFFGPIVGNLYDKHGARKLLVPGAIAVSSAFWFMTTFTAVTPQYFVLIAHVVLSTGLAFLFTPLFTLSLSSVPPQLYSYASATIGTIQQVAGAAGTAIFVTIYTIVLVGTSSSGTPTTFAMADGMHWAFISGAVLSLLVIVFAALIKQPSSPEVRAHELAH
jgi:DHA2 family lincomycin resistance protein-like MFS transporter